MAIALLLTSRSRVRLVLAPLIGASMAAFADLHTASFIGIVLVGAIVFWWTVRVVRLAFGLPAIAALLRPVATGAGASMGGHDDSGAGQPRQPTEPTTEGPRPEPQRIVDQPWAAWRGG